VTVIVREARLLPDLDGVGIAGGSTDAFVRASIGFTSKESAVVQDSNDPIWPASSDAVPQGYGFAMDFGVRDSGEAIQIELFDKDSGFEFGDDLIATMAAVVPGCSPFRSSDCAEKSFLPIDP